jgi:hypothetical protein
MSLGPGLSNNGLLALSRAPLRGPGWEGHRRKITSYRQGKAGGGGLLQKQKRRKTKAHGTYLSHGALGLKSRKT